MSSQLRIYKRLVKSGTASKQIASISQYWSYYKIQKTYWDYRWNFNMFNFNKKKIGVFWTFFTFLSKLLKRLLSSPFYNEQKIKWLTKFGIKIYIINTRIILKLKTKCLILIVVEMFSY